MLPKAAAGASSHRSWQTGGAVLAVIAGLVVVAASTLAIRMARQVEDKTALQQLTQQRMQRVAQALQAYSLVHGCPLKLPDGAIGDSTSVGDAVAGGTTVPWRTLGIPREDSLDAWGRKISYTNTVQVSAFGGAAESADWVLVSHGPTGLGAWTDDGQQILPAPANTAEQDNANLTSPLQRRQENSSPDVLPVDLFDDFLLWGNLDSATCPPATPPIVGAPASLNLTTNLLNSVSPVSYSGRDSNQAAITIDGGTDLGNITITSSVGNISRNGVPSGTAIGACTTGCGNNSNSSLSSPETLSFKLDSKTAEKFALGVLSLDPTVQVAVTFRRDGSDLGLYVSPVVSAVPGVVTVLPDLMPAPAAPFDEVVIQPMGSSHFFVASIRFCEAAVACN